MSDGRAGGVDRSSLPLYVARQTTPDEAETGPDSKMSLAVQIQAQIVQCMPSFRHDIFFQIRVRYKGRYNEALHTLQDKNICIYSFSECSFSSAPEMSDSSLSSAVVIDGLEAPHTSKT